MQRVPEADLQYDAAEGAYYLGDQPFTGVAYRTYPNGTLMSETEYRDGHFFGVSRGWWESGALENETHYFLGAAHGKVRIWHQNGQLAEDGDYEHGIRIRRKQWDESGALLEDYELSESDPGYQLLMLARQAYGD